MLFTFLTTILMPLSPKIVTVDNFFESYLSRWNTAVSLRGDIYVLDVLSQRIHHIQPQSGQKSLIGGLGEGPGEFKRPTQLFVDGEHLLITDQGGHFVNVFTLDGNFVTTITAPAGMRLIRARKSWVYGNWRYVHNLQTPVTLYFGDHAFTREHPLFSWPRHGDLMQKKVATHPGAPLKIPYNPSPDFPKLSTTFSGDLIYVYQPGPTLRIHVIDTRTEQRIKLLDLTVKPAPFDDRWANDMLQQESRLQRKRGHRVQHLPNYPEYFPMASMLVTDEEGNLVIGRMTKGSAPMQYLALDRDGGPVSKTYPLEKTHRVIAVHGNEAWVSILVEDQAALVRAPKNKIAQIFAKYDP